MNQYKACPTFKGCHDTKNEDI